MPLSLILSGGAGLHRGRWMTGSSSDVHCDITLGKQLFAPLVEGLGRVCSVRFRGLAKVQMLYRGNWWTDIAHEIGKGEITKLVLF